MAHNVSALLSEYFGDSLDTHFASDAFTVGTSVVQISKANSRRTIMRIANLGAAAIVLDRNPGVTTAAGIPLAPNSILVLDWIDDGLDVTLPWFAVSGGAGNAVQVLSTVLNGGD